MLDMKPDEQFVKVPWTHKMPVAMGMKTLCQ